MTAQVKMLIGGEWREGATKVDVRDPYRGEVIAQVSESTVPDLDDALKAATAAKAKAAAMPGYERAALLRRVGQLLVERADEIAQIMSRESGKAISDARAEVVRSQETVLLSAGEAIRIHGEQVPLDAIRRLRVGGVIVNGTSSWRTDQLAYGGVKASGIGREGPHYAIREMTDERLVVFNL